MRMRALLIGGLSLAVAAATSSSALHAQVRWDEPNGAYWVTVRDDDGVAREMRVQPSNRVKVSVNLLGADTSGAVVSYRYEIGVAPDSPQGLMFLRIPCSSTAQVQTVGQTRMVSRREWGGLSYCTIDIEIAAGQSRIVRVTSTLMPGVDARMAVAVGATEPPRWPTNDPNEETAELESLVDSLRGRSPNGLVLRVRLPAPLFPVATVASTAGLAIVRQQLEFICTQTDWIPASTTCNDLTTLLLPTMTVALRSAPSSGSNADLTANERRAVRVALKNFMDALETGRGTTIHQNAFAVLHLLARTTRGGV